MAAFISTNQQGLKESERASPKEDLYNILKNSHII